MADSGMDAIPEDWISNQKQVFTNWMNVCLNKVEGSEPVEELFADLGDGVKLCQLLGSLLNKRVSFAKNPRNKYQKLGNLLSALEATKEADIRLVNIAVEDIYDGKPKLILGYVWSLILRFQVSSADDGGKSELLEWCNAHGAGAATNFSTSWTGGDTLCGLIDHLTGGLVSAACAGDAGDARARVAKALEVAQDHLDIPSIITPEMVMDGVPDDKAMMTYLGYFPSATFTPPHHHEEEEQEEMDLGPLKELIPALGHRFRDVLLPKISPAHADALSKASDALLCAAGDGGKDYDLVAIVRHLGDFVEAANAKFDGYARLQDRCDALESELSEKRGLMHSLKASLEEVEHIRGEYDAIRAQLQTTLDENAELKGLLETLRYRLKVAESRQVAETREPPTGDVTLVFTDVQSSTVQWEKDPGVMAAAMARHNELFRELIVEFNGYEVKTEGDAFMIAFDDPFDALNLCMAAQERLLAVEWPESLYSNADSAVECDGATGQELWRGLRVRMGMHSGEPTCERDPITGRMDYFGPMVNRSARVEGVSAGGQVVISAQALDRVPRERLAALEGGMPSMECLGDFRLKGLDFDMTLHQFLPKSLEARTFESKQQAASTGIKEQLAAMQERNAALLQTVEKLNNRANDGSAKVASLQSKLTDLMSAMADSDDERLGAVVSSVKELVHDQESLLADLQGVQSFASNMQHELDQAQGSAGKAVEGVRKELTAEIDALTAQLEGNTKGYNILKDERDVLAATLQHREEEVANLTASIEETNAAIAALQAQKAERMAKLSALQEDLDVSEEDRKALREKAKESVAEIEERTAQLRTVLRAAKMVNDKFNELMSRYLYRSLTLYSDDDAIRSTRPPAHASPRDHHVGALGAIHHLVERAAIAARLTGKQEIEHRVEALQTSRAAMERAFEALQEDTENSALQNAYLATQDAVVKAYDELNDSMSEGAKVVLAGEVMRRGSADGKKSNKNGNSQRMAAKKQIVEAVKLITSPPTRFQVSNCPNAWRRVAEQLKAAVAYVQQDPEKVVYLEFSQHLENLINVIHICSYDGVGSSFQGDLVRAMRAVAAQAVKFIDALHVRATDVLSESAVEKAEKENRKMVKSLGALKSAFTEALRAKIPRSASLPPQ